jgi:uncharacterized protein (TIGR03066 family)
VRLKFTPALVLMLAVGWALAPAAPVPKAKAKTLDEKVLGKWKLVASQGQPQPNSNFRIVYKKGGELEFHREQGAGREPVVFKGKYKTAEPTDENKLGTIEWTINEDGEERGEVSRITELEDDVLEFKDPQGLVERFERVKDEKDGKKEEKKDK